MIGVVGAADGLAEAFEGAPVSSGTAVEVLAASPEVVVARGEAAVCALVRAGIDVPLLPVAVDDGLGTVSAERAPRIVEHGRAAGFESRELPVLEVTVDGEALGRGVFDAMLVTSDPARISEYAVETPGGVDRFRADGVAVATPAGSHGYTRAVGGPVLDPDAGGLVVLPVAAFTIQPTVRVASADASLTVRVERDDGAVALLVDGEPAGSVPPQRPVAVERDGTVQRVVDPGG